MLTSFWRHTELSRDDQSLEWGAVEEHWAGPISDEQVWRDFGDEAWRRWEEIVARDIRRFEPEVGRLVSRRLADLAASQGWAVDVDDETSFAVQSPAGQRIAAWFASGTWLRMGPLPQRPDVWLETNDLSALERVVAAVLRGDIELPADQTGGLPAGQLGTTLQWGTESWLTLDQGAPFSESDVSLARERAIAHVGPQRVV